MNDRYRKDQERPEENENQLEGRNALTEALRSGRTIDKVFIAAGETDRGLQHLAAQAKEAETRSKQSKLTTGPVGSRGWGKTILGHHEEPQQK